MTTNVLQTIHYTMQVYVYYSKLEVCKTQPNP